MSTKQIERTYNLAQFLFWFSTALPLALVVLLFQARGMTVTQVGWLFGVHALTIVFLELPTGGLADAIGRKQVSLLAYSTSIVTTVIFIFSFSFPALLLGTVLMGVGRALASGALDAWFVDALQAADPDVDLQPPLARAGTWSLLALGGGSLLGGLIPSFFSFLPADGTAVLTPLVVPLLFSLIVRVALLVVVARGVVEVRPATAGIGDSVAQVPQIVREAGRQLRRSPALLLLLSTALVLGLALSSIETFWQPHFSGLLGEDTPPFTFGVIMAGNFLLGMVGNMGATALSRLFRQRYALMAAVLQLAQGAMLILAAVQLQGAFGVAFLWLYYGGAGLLNSPRGALINQLIPAAQRSSMLSIYSLVGYVGSFIGSAGLGYVAAQAGISWAWIVAGAIVMVSFVAYLPLDRRRAAAPGGAEQHVDAAHEQETAVLETA